MHTFKTGKGEFIFVEVPESACKFKIIAGKLCHKYNHSVYWSSGESVPDSKFIAKTPGITEEDAALIVDNNGMGCYDNYRLKRDEKYTCTSALQSFDCLLKTISLTGNFAILKIES